MQNDKTKLPADTFVNTSIIATIILVLLIGICSLSYNKRAKLLNQGDCFATLSNSSADAAQRIESNLVGGIHSLRIIAKVIGNSGSYDPKSVQAGLSVFETNPISNNIAVLTSDNTIIRVDGSVISAEGLMDFESEAQHGEHICEFEESVYFPDKTVIHGFIPIEMDGKVTGLLFNEFNTESAAKQWAPEMYDGDARFTIINRETGDVLINNCEALSKNITEIHNEHLITEAKAGHTGYMAFPIHGRLTFACYIPMTIADWEVIYFVDSDKTLAASNRMKKNFHTFLFEEGIVFLLFMAWIFHFNRSSVRNTEKNANSDTLTGLPNRNMYESYCSSKADSQSDLACIYIDVNGLHEVNNSQGHLAGDQMLRFIADTLKVTFTGAEIFRIGGDEFIVFQEKSSGSGLNLKIGSVKEQLRNNDYYISAGISYGSKNNTIKDIIKDAEKKMFEDKKKYYEERGQEVRNFIQTPIDKNKSD